MFLSTLILLVNNAFSHDIIMDLSWDSRPNIIVCKDSTSITKERVKEAFDYWINDYDIDFSYKNIDYSNDCKNKKYENIYITGEWTITDETIANTRTSTFYYDYNPSKRYIDRAIVQIPESHSDNKIVLLHEIGHAIGLAHSQNNIMTAYHYF